MNIRILLVDDHAVLREGLRALIEKEPDLEVVGEASDGRGAVRLARELAPDIVLMDVAMPGLNGVDATRELLRVVPATKVIGLSTHSNPAMVTGILKAGALGYVLKESAFDELARAIRLVASGQQYLNPRAAAIVLDDYRCPAGRDDRGLTPREREILQLVAEGSSSAEIATKLYISRKTVDTHRRRILQKVGARNVTELVKFALREGLITLG